MEVAASNQPQNIASSRVAVLLGPGTLQLVGKMAGERGAHTVLLVSDPGIVAAGHPATAMASLRDAGLKVHLFSDVGENPTTEHVAAGVQCAKAHEIDFIIGLGGGSSMDCAKGINFILTNGGRMQDYWGVDLAIKPLLPMIAVPTTAGTGSDAQSYALITDPTTHQKMACGSRSALPTLAILDAELTATQPPKVAAATGIDAITHAVESSASTKRTDVSRELSRQAWTKLSGAFETAMKKPSNVTAREQMLMGAHLAGAAIENSMLGAAHALANALTAEAGIVHGVAVGLMMPHVIRFNAAANGNPYSDLDSSAERLARRVESMLKAGGLPTTLRDAGVTEDQLQSMAVIAARQWTAKFNPRVVGESEFRLLLGNAL